MRTIRPSGGNRSPNLFARPWRAATPAVVPPDDPETPPPVDPDNPEEPVPVTIIPVSTTAQLMTVLKTAVPGTRIELASGTYSGLNFKYTPLNAASNPIVIGPQGNAAVRLTNFSVSGLAPVSGLRIEDVELYSTNPSGVGFTVKNADTIEFRRIRCHGLVDTDPTNDAHGIGISNSSNIVIASSDFTSLARAILVSYTFNITITRNFFHHLRSDGIDVGQCNGIQIFSNTFTDFNPVLDHPDCIQFTTRNNDWASRNAHIHDNLMVRGPGAYTQGIFITDQVGTYLYENINVYNNLLIGTGYSAIRLLHVKNSLVHTNELITLTGGPTVGNKTWLQIHGDTVTVRDNKGTLLDYDAVTNLTQSGNVITSPVGDLGAAALAAWLAWHPNQPGASSITL